MRKRIARILLMVMLFGILPVAPFYAGAAEPVCTIFVNSEEDGAERAVDGAFLEYTIAFPENEEEINEIKGVAETVAGMAQIDCSAYAALLSAETPAKLSYMVTKEGYHPICGELALTGIGDSVTLCLLAAEQNQAEVLAAEPMPLAKADAAPAALTEPAAEDSEKPSGKIDYKDGFHFIEGKDMLLYCMNNKLRFPHDTEEIGDEQVPGYLEGYLTEKDFVSREKYEEFLERITNLLYAGYPHNGAALYEIVSDKDKHVMQAEEFNKMLIPPTQLADAFPKLKHYAFAYPAGAEELAVLKEFVQGVANLPAAGTTANGLSKSAIQGMPFYKAAVCMVWDAKDTPMAVFAAWYGAEYFVTEEQAYDATQLALWKLLYDYGIADNDISSLQSNALAENLTAFAEQGKILRYEPQLSELKLEGDMTFQYHPKDGLYHSQPLKLIGPAEYNGIYQLILPEGVSTIHNMPYVYGNEEYELIADKPIGERDRFGVKADFLWLREFQQYSPSPDIAVNGKKFQHMAGTQVQHTPLTATLQHDFREEGSLSISKKLVGADSGAEFTFQLELSDESIRGRYGDIDFYEGYAQFSLKHGETKTAKNLPAGTQYRLTEISNGEFYVESENAVGVIQKDTELAATFINTPLPHLTLGKIVTGEDGNQQKLFTFAITLQDSAGKPINGYYEYTGSVKPGYEATVAKPADDWLKFVDGMAQVQLSHGQQITLLYLPYQGSYAVKELEENQDGYTTLYNKQEQAAMGILSEDAEVRVENHKGALLQTPPKPTEETPVKPTEETPAKPVGESTVAFEGDRPIKSTEETPPAHKEEKFSEHTEEIPSVPTTENTSTPALEITAPPEPKFLENPMLSEQTEQKKTDTALPQTGDATKKSFWMAMMGISLVGMLAILRESRRENQRNCKK